ncbi:MAG: hypothetical protein AAGD43_22920 [Pseudomonadota bacterium]
MGKYDKDRFQKELAIRYCLARGQIPFVEVVVRGQADLSDTVEVLTDLDVLGVDAVGDGSLRRTLYDCKTSNKLSSINRAFWASGVLSYTGCNDAIVIQRNKAVSNHRISALTVNVDLHDETSFHDLGQTVDPGFPSDTCYQASIDRWNDVAEVYKKCTWASELFEFARNVIPLSNVPWSTFRKCLVEIRSAKGNFDPEKPQDVCIFLDVLASMFVLWATLGRDIRRFYDPSMNKGDFEKVLRYYLWGGKEAYGIRQQLRARSDDSGAESLELPDWEGLVKFAGLIVSAPQYLLECGHITRELSIKMATGSLQDFDAKLAHRIKSNSHSRQYILGLTEYLVSAGGLPKDMVGKVSAHL